MRPKSSVVFHKSTASVTKTIRSRIQVKSTLRDRAFKSAKLYNEGVQSENMYRLKPQQWLSDDIIGYYAGLIFKRNEESKGKLPAIHYFNSFFYHNLTDPRKGYSGVRRWTKKVSFQ